MEAKTLQIITNELYKYGKLIKEDEEGMCLVETALKEINGALKDAALIEVPNNLAVIGAFSYYKLLDERKANEFLKWVKEK